MINYMLNNQYLVFSCKYLSYRMIAVAVHVLNFIGKYGWMTWNNRD